MFGMAAITCVPVAAAQAAAVPQGRHSVAAAGPQITRNATDKGAAPKAQKQTLRVYLAPNGGEDALKAAIDAISTPGSATYGQFLTPAQFHAQYAPTDATIKSVKQWL